MTATEINEVLRIRSEQRARAERLLHAELRARLLATSRRLELARTPLDLATPGSLSRFFAAMQTAGDSADKWTRFANRARALRDDLLLRSLL